jgi:spore coat protein U-like protein
MRKSVLLFIFAATTVVVALDKAPVNVKSSNVSNNVILVNVVENGKEVQLQCNDGQSFCIALKPGAYQIVHLPKNRGLYDCKCVDIYSANADPDKDEKLGEYCIGE